MNLLLADYALSFTIGSVPVLEEKLVPVGFSSTPFSGIASTLLPLVRYSYFRNLLLT